MCDCYSAGCEECGKAIPIHIADFCTDRENVKAWCPEHINYAPINANTTRYTLTDDEYVKGIIAIEILDETSYGIHPNCCYKDNPIDKLIREIKEGEK